MGNKILTQYDVQKEPCYYSPELRWKLHSASFKEKPEDKLTIFLFERKVIEKYAKNSKERIVELLKKDAMCLQRLRHPHILSVIEALVEERSTLAFATKPVVGTVAQLLENNRHELSNLEMKCGLLDVAEAMQFLHQDAKTAHLGFSPYSIFIDPQGKWLLGGLGFSFSGVQWGQLMDCPFGFTGQEDSVGGGGATDFDLFKKWWFYVILFFCIYAFSVVVHLFFDYRQWEADRVRLILQEASQTSGSSDPHGEEAKKEE